MITIVGGNKGGSGKTTTVTNLAVALAKRGNEVVLVDADHQRSLSRWIGDRESQELSPELILIEKRDNLTQTLKSLDNKYDHVLVDVAGRNSREMITGATVADLLIAPHQASQLDLDTLAELEEQLERVHDLNPDLQVFVYHSMASTNSKVKDSERDEFLEYVSEFKEFKPLKARGFYRKVYKDAIPAGKSVLELDNSQAIDEINELVNEVYYGD